MSRFTLAFLFALCCGTCVRADTIVITGGSLSNGTISGTQNLFGFSVAGQGFSAFGGGDRFSNRFPTGATLTSRGDFVIDLTGVASGSDITGEFTYLGTTYRFWRLDTSMTLGFSAGTVVIPPELRDVDNLLITAPFTLSGAFTAPGIGTNFLTGQGVLFLTVRRNAGGAPIIFYEVPNFNYVILPPGAPLPQTSVVALPEPATLLLFGTGLAGVVGAARRRRRRS